MLNGTNYGFKCYSSQALTSPQVHLSIHLSICCLTHALLSCDVAAPQIASDMHNGAHPRVDIPAMLAAHQLRLDRTRKPPPGPPPDEPHLCYDGTPLPCRPPPRPPPGAHNKTPSMRQRIPQCAPGVLCSSATPQSAGRCRNMV